MIYGIGDAEPRFGLDTVELLKKCCPTPIPAEEDSAQCIDAAKIASEVIVDSTNSAAQWPKICCNFGSNRPSIRICLI